eukprot:scaffold8672_cov50-Attheya_sp.AAC.1
MMMGHASNEENATVNSFKDELLRSGQKKRNMIKVFSFPTDSETKWPAISHTALLVEGATYGYIDFSRHDQSNGPTRAVMVRH